MRGFSWRGFFYWMLLSIFLTAGSPVWARTAWIGLAGSGDGMALLGHAFIVLQDDDADILASPAYSYKVELVDPLGFSELLDFALASSGLRGEVRFSVTKRPLGEEVLDYSGREERELRLFALTMTDAEIARFERRLEGDLNDPSFSKNSRFDLTTNNCVTRPLSHLNAVVPASRAVYLSSFWDKFLPSPDFLEAPGASVLARMPLYLPVLMRSHPISAHREIDFGRDVRHRAIVYLRKIKPQIRALSSCRAWTPEFEAVVEAFLLHASHRPRAEELARFRELELLEPCAASPELWRELATGFLELIPATERASIRRLLPRGVDDLIPRRRL